MYIVYCCEWHSNNYVLEAQKVLKLAISTQEIRVLHYYPNMTQ